MEDWIVAIKNNKIIHKEDCSRNLAKKMIEDGLISGKEETVARAIRKRANDGRESYGYYFQKI